MEINELLPMLKEIYESMMPFNKWLGIEVTRIDLDQIDLRFTKKPEMIGNFTADMLHGGVISSVIDLAGGIVSQAVVLDTIKDLPMDQLEARFKKMSTIDLRIDYLRPGQGETFTCTASVVRMGNKVAVAQMEFKNEGDLLIAIGTGSYLVG
jgi:uncharacterized protein (TIGR00369 family)